LATLNKKLKQKSGTIPAVVSVNTVKVASKFYFMMSGCQAICNCIGYLLLQGK
jgi:hypothetical protein